ncbi:MAG: hypothetical protein LN588_03380 [Rickettsia endosymbiont of Bryobia graminum]|nr:hypothetical protein [Rickettsia endosymbiont of Bryobia graminum]
MDRKFTEGRKEILTREGVDIKKASLGELYEAMQQFSLNNPYKDISRKLREKQLIEQTSDTIWKWFASACGSIGMSNLKNYFIEKDTKAKTAIIAQKLGLKINTVKSLVTKGNKQFAQESVNKNKSKSSEHQH